MKRVLRFPLILYLLILTPPILLTAIDQPQIQHQHPLESNKVPESSVLAGSLSLDSLSPPNSNLLENHLSSEDIVDFSKLPKDFFWGDIQGINYLTMTRNQHSPQYCQSSWAFGTTSAIGDRFKIMRKNTYPEINLSPQVLINCKEGGSCNGGTPIGAYQFLKIQGVQDETCQNYQARNNRCRPNGSCENCTPFRGNVMSDCRAVLSAEQYFISEFGDLSSTQNTMSNSRRIQAEIYARGPVTCTLFATRRFDAYTGGIFSQLGLWISANHVVSLVGWGEENGIKYWIGRNSLGTYWGENGFFRIRRDSFFRNLGIENSCTFATPVIPAHLKPDTPLPHYTPYGEYLLEHHHSREGKAPEDPLSDLEEDFERLFPIDALDSQESPAFEDQMSLFYDIRNISGINFASVNRNQNNPRYCESSWAQSAASALNDRFSLLRNGQFPEIVLSVQVLLNCVKEQDHPCRGTGTPGDAYAFIREHFLPDESCSPYEAKKHKCREIEVCKICQPGNCRAILSGEFAAFRVSEFGRISGSDQIFQEVSKNGPIACRICPNEEFLSYTGGIFNGIGDCSNSSAFVVLSGWGEDNGVKYWIGRNSWGTYWGEEQGWFRVSRTQGQDLGITEDCYWANPVKPHFQNLYTSSSTAKIT